MSDIGSVGEKAPVSSYEVYRSEAEDLYRKAMYQKAIDSFTMALELRSDDPYCLISRAQCYLKNGQNELALKDTDSVLSTNGDFYKAIYMKAECYYQIGNFEMALVFYHRGHNLRPEVEDFSLGIRKASEAIENSVGVPDAIRLVASAENGYYSQNKFNKPPSLMDSKKAGGSKTKYDDPRLSKQLLEELYEDKEYLESLLKDGDICSKNSESGSEITNLVTECLNYLNFRADFWLQHKPIYARDRERKILLQGKNEVCKDINVIIANRTSSLTKKFDKGKYDQVRESAIDLLGFVNSHPRENINNYQHTLVSIYNLIATSAFELADYGDAQTYYTQLINCIQNSIALKESKARAQECLVICQMKGGIYNEAVENLTQMLATEKKKDGNEAVQEIWVIHELARCHYELESLQEAENYAKRAFDLAKSIYSGEWMLNTAVILAKISEKRGRSQDAMEYYESALKLSKALNDNVGTKLIQVAIENLQKSNAEGCDEEDIKATNEDCVGAGGENDQ